MSVTLEMARVRFLRPFRAYKPGQVVTVTKGVARSLQLSKLAEPFLQPQLELAVTPEPVVERAVAPAAKAPRRRRQKS